MSDYELLDKLIPLLNSISMNTPDETEDMFDIAKDYLNEDEYNMLVKLLNI